MQPQCCGAQNLFQLHFSLVPEAQDTTIAGLLAACSEQQGSHSRERGQQVARAVPHREKAFHDGVQ